MGAGPAAALAAAGRAADVVAPAPAASPDDVLHALLAAVPRERHVVLVPHSNAAQWWPEQDVAALFPDDDVRARVERRQPRLPLAYFHGTGPAPPGWDALPCAYLAFGSTYDEEVARATAAGWVVSRLPGEHLHMLVDPDGVAAEVDRLLRLVTGA